MLNNFSIDFYTNFCCPQAHRSFIALLEAQLAGKIGSSISNHHPCEKVLTSKSSSSNTIEGVVVPLHYHEIDLEKQEHKSDAYLRINQQGLVPALVLNMENGLDMEDENKATTTTTMIIVESLTINEFLHDLFGILSPSFEKGMFHTNTTIVTGSPPSSTLSTPNIEPSSTLSNPTPPKSDGEEFAKALKLVFMKAQSRIWTSYFENNIGSWFMKLFMMNSKQQVLDEILPILQERMFFMMENGYKKNNPQYSNILPSSTASSTINVTNTDNTDTPPPPIRFTLK
jgi:hypothetical protein